ncbi:MAG: hypothetical protein MK077_10735, partial [Phycisphaerales bacterium]|nr:hypothetical protein [Phycisphaerales bacterium]
MSLLAQAGQRLYLDFLIEPYGISGQFDYAMSSSTVEVNIIFVNIDWKTSRHNSEKNTKRNLTLLADTTSRIVTNMKPAVICCCEVGTAMEPMTWHQMLAMANAMREAWENASAPEHPAIECLFESDAPYLTIWDDNRCQCTHGRIMQDVYKVKSPHRRMAQAFLCTMPGEGDEEGIHVVNVHAPSGRPSLTDNQRLQLIQTVVESKHMTRAKRSIGDGRFLIGGDMNTSLDKFAQILPKLRHRNILKGDIDVMAPPNGKHGDLCVVGGFTPTIVQESADNHDPMHVPYGIVWRQQPQHATVQLTQGKVSASVLPTAEQPNELIETVTAQHRTVRGVVRPPADAEITHHTTEPPTQKGPDPIGAIKPQTEVSCDADTGTTRHATEQSHPDTEEPSTQKGPDHIGATKPQT